MSVIIGQGQFVEREPSETWDSNAGWATVRTWVGPLSQYQAFVQSQIPGGYTQFRKSQTSQTVTIEASYPISLAGGSDQPQPDPISTTWTLSYEKKEFTLYHSAYLRQVLSGTTVRMGQLKRAIELCVAAFSDPTPSETGFSSWACFPSYYIDEEEEPVSAISQWDSLSAEVQSILREVYARFLDDAGTFEVATPVLRKQHLLSSVSQITASHKNIGALHTQAKLYTDEPTLPSALLIGLDDPSFASYSWLKETPTIEATSQGRWELTQEYRGVLPADPILPLDVGQGLYDDLIYPTAV